jgi:hypothetical protein
MIKAFIIFSLSFYLFSAQANDPCLQNLRSLEQFLAREITHSPDIHWGCINTPTYLNTAALIFMNQTDELFMELDNLESRALQFRGQINLSVYDLEEEMSSIIRAYGSIPHDQRGKFIQTVAIIQQDIAQEQRAISNMLGTVKATGHLMSRLLSEVSRNDPRVLIRHFGFESFDEVYALRDFLIQYGSDSRDSALEIDRALSQIQRAQARVTQISQRFLQ